MNRLGPDLRYCILFLLPAEDIFRMQCVCTRSRQAVELVRRRRVFTGRVRALLCAEFSFGRALVDMLDADPELAEQLPIAGSLVLAAINGASWTRTDGADCDFWAETPWAAAKLRRWLLRRHDEWGADRESRRKYRAERAAQEETDRPNDDYAPTASTVYNFRSAVAPATDPKLQIIQHQRWRRPELEAETNVLDSLAPAPTAEDVIDLENDADLDEDYAIDGDDSGSDDRRENDGKRVGDGSLDAAPANVGDTKRPCRPVFERRPTPGTHEERIERVTARYDWDWCKCAWTPRRLLITGRAAIRDRTSEYRSVFLAPNAGDYANMLRRTLRYAARGYHGTFPDATLVSLMKPFDNSTHSISISSDAASAAKLATEFARFRAHLGDTIETVAATAPPPPHGATRATTVWEPPVRAYRRALYHGFGGSSHDAIDPERVDLALDIGRNESRRAEDVKAETMGARDGAAGGEKKPSTAASCDPDGLAYRNWKAAHREHRTDVGWWWQTASAVELSKRCAVVARYRDSATRRFATAVRLGAYVAQICAYRRAEEATVSVAAVDKIGGRERRRRSAASSATTTAAGHVPRLDSPVLWTIAAAVPHMSVFHHYYRQRVYDATTAAEVRHRFRGEPDGGESDRAAHIYEALFLRLLRHTIAHVDDRADPWDAVALAADDTLLSPPPESRKTRDEVERVYASCAAGDAVARVLHGNWGDFWCVHLALMSGVPQPRRFHCAALDIAPTATPLSDLAHAVYCRRTGWQSELPEIRALVKRLGTSSSSSPLSSSLSTPALNALQPRSRPPTRASTVLPTPIKDEDVIDPGARRRSKRIRV